MNPEIPTLVTIETLFPNLRDELLENNDNNIVYNKSKCPEVEIQFYNVSINALIDTGSMVNGLAEDWFHIHKNDLGRFETLSVMNTTIVSAVGNKSKHIKRQILCEININNKMIDCIFLIIPGLV